MLNAQGKKMSEYQRGYAQGFEDGCNFMKTTEGSLNNAKKPIDLQREQPSTGQPRTSVAVMPVGDGGSKNVED